MAIEVTEWIPCAVHPIRDGWYEVQRMHGAQPIGKIERVRFANGEWDREACTSKLAVWRYCDYWRGVTEASKEG